MHLSTLSRRLTRLVIELTHDKPLDKKLIKIYFNELIDLDEKALPTKIAIDLESIKLMFSDPDAVPINKLSKPELVSLASRIVLLMSEVSYQAGLQARPELGGAS